MKLTTKTTQILLDEATYLDNKPDINHDMNCFLMAEPGCQTTSCAFGDIAITQSKDAEDHEFHKRFAIHSNPFLWIDFHENDYYQSIADYLQIEEFEARFLFQDELAISKELYIYRRRNLEEPKTTAARIRKFVYYKLRKQDLLDTSDRDSNGLTAYDHSRKIGSVDIMQSVLENV